MHPIVDEVGAKVQHAAVIEEGMELSEDEHFCADVEDQLLGKGHRERVLLFWAGTREKRRISGSRC
jgi:hypothetical protein